MARSHKIWVDVTGGSGKPFGCGNDDICMNTLVGTSGRHSKQLTKIKLSHYEADGKIKFEVTIDGQRYRRESIDIKTKDYDGIIGHKINGDPALQRKREEDNSNSMLRSVAAVAMIGEIFGETQKEKNDWKARMLKAGLENRGLIMPDDWDQLSEDEKEKRLNGVIDVLKEETK